MLRINLSFTVIKNICCFRIQYIKPFFPMSLLCQRNYVNTQIDHESYIYNPKLNGEGGPFDLAWRKGSNHNQCFFHCVRQLAPAPAQQYFPLTPLQPPAPAPASPIVFFSHIIPVPVNPTLFFSHIISAPACRTQ